MTNLSKDLQADIDKINQISIVPKLLEVICRSTGMGFSAVARVTDEKWIACSVRDEINFGLKPGGELELQTTICDEIRQTRQAVVFDNAALDPFYCNHHTPKQYGLQSYISIPIVLTTGEFFGTLCAIDPNPAKVNDKKIIGMFTLFAQLIALHLQVLDTLESNLVEFQSTKEQLLLAKQENKKYEHITYHSLREPVRKISYYTDMLLAESNNSNHPTIASTATAVHRYALDLSGMLQQLNPDGSPI